MGGEGVGVSESGRDRASERRSVGTTPLKGQIFVSPPIRYSRVCPNQEPQVIVGEGGMEGGGEGEDGGGKKEKGIDKRRREERK